MDTSATSRRPRGPADADRAPAAAARLVLVVDDDPDLQFLVRRLLEDAGYLVDCAGDGREALARIGLLRPDLVVLDIKMPVMDGWEVLSRLRAVPDAPPVVVLSTCAEERRAAHAGAVACLHKPFGFRALVGTCRDALEHRPLPGDRATTVSSEEPL